MFSTQFRLPLAGSSKFATGAAGSKSIPPPRKGKVVFYSRLYERYARDKYKQLKFGNDKNGKTHSITKVPA